MIKALDGTLQGYHHTQLQMLPEDYDHVQKQGDFLDKSITELSVSITPKLLNVLIASAA
ncbi:hypothetical protein [Mucilaginibacter ginsenosidivorax]|uniref:hypothetical protein n=1 Tax=Mucilaginibacter ginsenosidivorax TaxID=862126 RepID=UPI0013157E77|nr:hypothetical protein [Mucilaginibacter ginsenosidivorax]